MKRRDLVLGSVAALASRGGARAQSAWPNKTIRFIVPFAPGGGTDTVSRLVCDQLSRILGQQVVVENKPGAASSIAGTYVARAAKDGYTLYIASAANMINAAMSSTLQFDVMKDFAPVALITSTPTVLVVSPELGVKSVKELVALAKSKPGTI